MKASEFVEAAAEIKLEQWQADMIDNFMDKCIYEATKEIINGKPTKEKPIGILTAAKRINDK